MSDESISEESQIVVKRLGKIGRFESVGRELGVLVQEKNEAYGDSFGQANKILKHYTQTAFSRSNISIS